MALLPLLLAALLLVLALPQPGRAAEQLSLVTGEDYPPYVDARAPGGGVAVQLVRQVVQRMGATAEIDTAPWRRGYEETLRGRYDATFPYVRTPEREGDYLYSDPLIQAQPAIFMAAARRFTYRSVADLKGRRVCTPLGYAPAPQVRALLDHNEAERVTAPSVAACPGLLVAGRADYFIQDQRIGLAVVAKAGLTREVIAAPGAPFGTQELHVIVPRSRAGAADLIGRFNAALRQLRNSDDYDRLLTQ